MEDAELIKAARAEANCKQFYKQYNDCYGCPMPHKDNPSYQRMCVDFDEEVLPQLADALEEAEKRIAELEAAQRWIPVEERLPENDLPSGSKKKQIKVLTAIKNSKGVYTVRTQLRMRDYWIQCPDEWAWKYSGGNITHWQALPQPPQKGE